MKTKFITLKEYKKRAKDNDTDGLAIRKQFISKISEVMGSEKPTLKFSITTAQVDRDNDTIALAGWNFDEYNKNPVVLWGHDYRQLPIAKALTIVREAASIDSEAEFTSKELYEFGYMVYQMYKEGFLNAVSVGFQPTEMNMAQDRDEWGLDFTKQNLLEYSAVPVPSNPGALVQARSKGIDTLPLKAWAEKVLDSWEESEAGILMPKSTIELLRKDSDPKAPVQIPPPAKAAGSEPDTSDKDSGDTVKKRPIDWGNAHPDGTKRAPKDTDFVKADQVKIADVPGLMVMSAWLDDDKPDTKGAFKLVHHLGGDNHEVVWRGVTSAMKALLSGTADIPEEDKRGAYNHLAKHYEEFEESAPEFRFIEAQVLRTMPDDYIFNDKSGQLEKMTDEKRFNLAKDALIVYLSGGKELANGNEKILSALEIASNAFKEALNVKSDAKEAFIEFAESEPESKDLLEGIGKDEIASMVTDSVKAILRKSKGQVD